MCNKLLQPSYFIIFLLLIFYACQEPEREKNVDLQKEVSINIFSSPKTLNPFYYSNSTEKLLVQNIYQPILSVNDTRDGISPILVKALPEKIKSDSMTILRYRLKEDARWTNGRPVTSHDIATSFKIVFNPHTELDYLKEYFSFIYDVNIISDSQFDIVIKDFSPEKEFMSGDLDIVPAYIFDPDSLLDSYSVADLLKYDPKVNVDSSLLLSGNFNLELENEMLKISGSGPYEMQQFENSKSVVLKKKEEWWGNFYADSAILFKAFPNQLIFKIFDDPLPVSMALRNKELDLAYGLNQTQITQIKSESYFELNYVEESYLVSGFIYMGINSERQNLKNINTRKALAFLCDVDNYIDKILNGEGIPINSPVSPLNKTLYNQNIKRLLFSIDSAHYYLKKAGWKQEGSFWGLNGKILELDFLIQSGNKSSEDFAIFYKNNANRAGIKINLIPLEFSSFIERIKSGDYDLMRLGTSSSPLYYNYYPIFHSQAISEGKNYARQNNSLVDSLIDQLKFENDEKSRTEINHKLQNLIFNHYSYIFLYAPQAKAIVNKNLKGFEVSPANSSPWPASLQVKDHE